MVKIKDFLDLHECSQLIAKQKEITIKEDRELTIGEASERLGVSQQTLRNWEESGKLIPEKTEKGHRRYKESQVTTLIKKQMQMPEIILPNITPRQLNEQLFGSFDQDQKINLIISQGSVDGKVRFIVESIDGLDTFVKTYNIKED